jgi:LPXTG-motif cell wall-anchored protein
MVKLRLAAAAAIACAITLLSSGVAQAYSDCGVTLSLNDSTVVGGKTFTFTADAGSVDCDWTATYAGKTKTGSGTSFSGSFATKTVSKKTTTTINATCDQGANRVCPVSAHVILFPVGTAPADEATNGLLPDTGGSSLWILALGGVLVVGGAGVTYAARRRHNSR